LAPPLFVGLAFVIPPACRWFGANVRAECDALTARLALWRGKDLTQSEKRTIGRAGRALGWIVAGAALLAFALPTYAGVRVTFLENYQNACIFSIEDAEAAAEWANARLREDDLVMTTHVGWMLRARTTTPMLVELAEGGPGSPAYFSELRERFVYPTALSDVRWFITHEAVASLAAIYKFEPMVQRIAETWPMIHAEGSFRFYANPAFLELERPDVETE
jgi:hypothetical protein